MNTSTASLKLVGVAPAVCDAEAGQQHSSSSELIQAISSTGTGTGSSDEVVPFKQDPADPRWLGKIDEGARPMTATTCKHLQTSRIVTARSVGCEECEKNGDSWVHLRICLTCGHVGCCDDSRNRHGSAHACGTGHPAIASFEPGEHWAYCYPDDRFFKRMPPRFQIVRQET